MLVAMIFFEPKLPICGRRESEDVDGETIVRVRNKNILSNIADFHETKTFVEWKYSIKFVLKFFSDNEK